MKIHEYQGKAILKEFGVPVPGGDVADTPAQARRIAERLAGRVVVKAQVHAGGRGKAGGVKLADDPAGAEAAATQILGTMLKTPQTPPEGIKVLKVLVGARSAKRRETMQTTIDELFALQRADGGWSQTVPELKSDAFATGQTLYVLSLAGFTVERPEIERGIDFLVATQKPDGSWPMISRSTPDGSPGSSKLLTPITCAASSWATLGLARLAPKGN